MSLAPLRKLLQHGCMTAARAAAVAALHELQPVLSSCMSNRVPTLSSSRASWGPSHCLPHQARSFHAGAMWNAGVTVKVPALGESITDGTIATLLKQPGDAVAEDEPILQIETDKVTIDVRAPQAGVLEQFLVKEGDNVVVGQDITIISSGQGAPAAAPQPPAQQAAPAPPSPPAAAATPPPQPQQQQQPAPSPARPAMAAAPEPPKRQPLIKFPPRRTPAGERVSDMPAAQAKAFLAAAAKAAEEAARPRPLIAPLYQKSGPPLPRPARPLVRPAPQIPRTTMTDKEMEAIMLGGAEP